MMLIRTPSFAQSLKIDGASRDRIEALAQASDAAAKGMFHLNDYRALGAVCCDLRPRRIFEIGTYLGTTSNYLLEVLPEATVVSIAYVRPRIRLFSRKYNNSSLSRREVGSRVSSANRSRFHQLLGDSHKLSAANLLKEFGPFDLVLIDGDHTLKGVEMDTVLAHEVLARDGGICWHDANPIDKYLDVCRYLESYSSTSALATAPDYAGGLAYWHPSLTTRGIVPATPNAIPKVA
jgi:predicted O-methyltransferase YrrM